MTGGSETLPCVDEHSLRIAASRAAVWASLQRFVSTSLRLDPRHPVAFLLRTHPRAGFAVVERVPGERLRLGGRHRFSRYELTFELTERPDGSTQLTAATRAEFPGTGGAWYRALVIGTGAHALAVRSILRSVEKRSEGHEGERA